jgi:hypothetical protein
MRSSLLSKSCIKIPILFLELCNLGIGFLGLGIWAHCMVVVG